MSFKKPAAPEIFIVLTLLIFGGFALLWLPVGAGYDEETHFVRVWQMSNFEMLPNRIGQEQMPFPKVYWDMSYRRKVLIRPISADFFAENSQLSIPAKEYVYGVTTRSVYSPLLLLPQSLVVRYAGRRAGLPALTVFYFTRLAGLLSYLFLVWLAVRIIPYGKWLLAILALSPMALLQAVTISADTISNGIALLFIGATLLLASKKKIGKKEWWILVLLVFLLFAAKVNLFFLILLPLFLLTPSTFKTKKAYWGLIAVVVILFLLEGVGWSLLAYPRLGTTPEGTNPVGQIHFILRNFFFTIKVLFSAAFQYAGRWFLNWIALYGYDYWQVPGITYWFYGIALALSIFVKNNNERAPTKRERLIFGILFIIGYMTTIGLMYLSFTPVGAGEVVGVQGRYFFVVMPLLFLALFGQKKVTFKQRSWGLTLMLFFGTFSLVAYSLGGWLSYHVPCGSQYYTERLCYQPRYKNFSPGGNSSPALTNNLTISQEIVPECDGMTSLRFWVNNNSSSSISPETLLISLANLGGEVIYKDELPVTNITEQGWQSISFPPIWDSGQNAYLLTLTSSASTSEFTLAYSLRPEYDEGKLYENSEPIENDLIFQYGCIAGWKKLQHDRER